MTPDAASAKTSEALESTLPARVRGRKRGPLISLLVQLQ